MNLILTVGSGTAGKQSDIIQGLINTLAALQPTRYWLVPSKTSSSNADLIRSEHPAGFQPWSEQEPYRTISEPDDLGSCRTALREVIAAARKCPGKLVINPTSGTKQMSAGATLAALEEEVGELVFTVGPRAEGVVITGQEKMATFSTEDFLRERTLKQADLLYQSGAFKAAGDLLKRWKGHADADRAMHIACCAHEWHRLSYQAAAAEASRFDAQLQRHLADLARQAESDRPSEAILGDLLAGAEELRKWGDTEESTTRFYKAYEYAARLRLCEKLDLTLPFKESDFAGINLPEPVRLPPGLNQMAKVLQRLGDPFAEAYFQGLNRHLAKRNDAMHDIRPITPAEAQSLCDRIVNALLPFFPGLSRIRSVERPDSLLPP